MKFLFLLFMAANSVITSNSVVAGVQEDLEAYYLKQANDILQARFPGQPFLVSVKVTLVKTDTTASTSVEENPDLVPLPLIGVQKVENQDLENENDSASWPLSKKLKKVSDVKIVVMLEKKVEQETVNQVVDFMNQALNLKLGRDKVEIVRALPMKTKDDVQEIAKIVAKTVEAINIKERPKEDESLKVEQWISSFKELINYYVENFSDIIVYVLGGLIVLLFLFIGGFRKILFDTANKMHSLEESEANDSENKAGSTKLISIESASDSSSTPNQGAKGNGGIQSTKILQSKKELEVQLNLMLNLFSPLSPEVYLVIQKCGQEDPESVAGLFRILDPQVSRALIKYLRGNWVWQGIIGASNDSSTSFYQLMGELEQVKLRVSIKEDEEHVKAARLALARLEKTEIQRLLTQYSESEGLMILSLYGGEKAIKIARELYNENWVKLVTESFEISTDFAESVKTESYSIAPIRADSEVAYYLRVADMLRYIEVADLEMERELYKNLPDDSIIKQRKPFYSVWEKDIAVITKLQEVINNENWANALVGIKKEDISKLLAGMPERRNLMITEAIDKNTAKKIDSLIVNQARLNLIEKAFEVELSEKEKSLDS